MRDIVELYQRKISSLKENFLKVIFCFALTLDIWTSFHRMTGYLSVVAHYLDNDYNYFSIEHSQSSASNGSEELENVGGRVLLNSANLDWRTTGSGMATA